MTDENGNLNEEESKGCKKSRTKKRFKDLGVSTLAVHASAKPDPATGARSVPIYQTAAYVLDEKDLISDIEQALSGV